MVLMSASISIREGRARAEELVHNIPAMASRGRTNEARRLGSREAVSVIDRTCLLQLAFSLANSIEIPRSVISRRSPPNLRRPAGQKCDRPLTAAEQPGFCLRREKPPSS